MCACTVVKGQFVVIGQSVHEQGSYEIEVQTDESGFTYIESDLIKIDGNKMYFGDHSAPYANNFPTKTDSTRPFTKEVR